jgi:hypothetical protein
LLKDVLPPSRHKAVVEFRVVEFRIAEFRIVEFRIVEFRIVEFARPVQSNLGTQSFALLDCTSTTNECSSSPGVAGMPAGVRAERSAKRTIWA